MTKIIVKNCPCIKQIDIEVYRELEEHYVCKDTLELKDCQNVDNCLIKQIIEKCDEAIKPIRQWEENGTGYVEYGKDKTLAKEILEMFEIEEINE